MWNKDQETELYRQVLAYLETISDLVLIVLAPDNTIMKTNQAFQRFMQLSAEPTGRNLADFLAEKEDVHLLESCRQEGGAFRKIDLQLYQAHSSVHRISFHGVSLGSQLLLLGEKITLHESKILREFSYLSSQLNNLNRDLNKKTVELEKAYRRLQESEQSLQEQIEKAHNIHQRHLPQHFPEISGFSVAAHYLPAERLGGDFFDVIHKGNKLVAYVSDVSGHGLDAAMLSVFVRHTMNNYLFLAGDEDIMPGKMLQSLAQQYCRENYPSDYFICIFLVVVDLARLEISYTAAGFQVPLLLCSGEGNCSELFSNGPPISPVIPLELLNTGEGSFTLDKPSTILLSTDGLVEQSADFTPYDQRLKKVFYEHSHQSPREIIEAVKEDFRSFNQGTLQGEDDITFLVMQLDPNDGGEHSFFPGQGRPGTGEN